MNLEHIAAVMKAGTIPPKKATHGTDVLCTNGHILCRFDPPEDAGEYPKVAELWQKHLAVQGSPATVGGMVRFGLHHQRQVGEVWINEAYFRCFDGPGVTWTVTGKNQAVSAHSEGVLIGLVMPVRYYNYGVFVKSANDAQVFAPFACEANDYYLVDNKTLRREIAALEDELQTAEEAVEFAREEAYRIERRLELKRKAVDTQRQSPPGNDPPKPPLQPGSVVANAAKED